MPDRDGFRFAAGPGGTVDRIVGELTNHGVAVENIRSTWREQLRY